MSDLSYIVQYAKTERSTCKVCNEKINKGIIRFGIMLQSKYYDEKQTFWHHEECFFKKVMPKSIAEFAKFNILQYEDKLRIQAKIKSMFYFALNGQHETEFSEIKSGYLKFMTTFFIEYSKFNKAKCRHCKMIICKDEIRISKITYDPRYGEFAMWYHVKCFVERREDLLFTGSGDEIPGFEVLNEIDKKIIKDKIKNIFINFNTLFENTDLYLKLSENESKLFDSYRKVLSTLSKSELKSLADENKIDITSFEREDCLDQLADCMTFGVPELCPKCKQGQLVLDTFYYKCINDISAWSRCSFNTQMPQRVAIKVPSDLKSFSIFITYQGMCTQRYFLNRTSAETITRIIKSESASKQCLPLENLQFYLFGKFTSEEGLKQRIVGLGGLVINNLTKTTAAIVTTKTELNNLPVMKEAKRAGIEVIEESFFDFVDIKNGSITDSLNLIKEKNIANWGSDPFARIQYDNTAASTSGSTSKRADVVDTTMQKILIKNGMDVDPICGLQNISHVYKDEDKYYSVVLTKTDVDVNKNSFYKLQLLEADNQNKYWIFRSWGRTGTTIGSHKLEVFSLIDDAINHFKNIYMKKTKYGSFSGHHFVKIPRAYVPVDINYKDFPISKISIETNSTIALSVQRVIVKIFDVEVMKNCLLEYELDLEKMPLGKLSNEQIKLGYDILSRLLQDFEKRMNTDDYIKDTSNKFYTIIPHNFGFKKPPLLDNIEIIKKKIEMLDSLLQIEIAYKLLESASDTFLSPIESYYLKLNADIVPLDKTSFDYNLIMRYIKNTQYPDNDHTIEIEEAFYVSRVCDEERYNQYEKLHNKRLLWHGSRVTNFAGILSQGLRIAPPEAPATGYLFGKGVYFADMVSKSEKYCYLNINHPSGFILLCEVALGNSLQCYKAENIRSLPGNIHSVWGVGCTQPNATESVILDNGVVVPLGTPIKGVVNSKLIFNEFIVYDIAQIKIKYLVQIKLNYSHN